MSQLIMTNPPILSIVTPTLGKFSEYWLQQLLAIQEVTIDFSLSSWCVTPSLEDTRVKIFHSLYQGETAQMGRRSSQCFRSICVGSR